MFSEYALFDIRIRGVGPKRYDVDVQSDLGGDARGVFVSPLSDPTFQQQLARLQALDTDEELLTAIGQRLFLALFQGGIKDVYTRSQGSLGPEQGLRLRFSIDPALTTLASLPWEFLFDPDRAQLGLLDAPIVRYLVQQSRPPVLKPQLPLKVLLTGAQTPPAADVARELHEVRAALRDLEQRGLVVVHFEEHLTRTKLQGLLRQKFQIWHFTGHGELSEDKLSSRLVLEENDGSPDPVSASQLRIFFDRSGLQLIVLDACNSGELTTAPYRSIAPALIQAQAGAVVAMQFKVPTEATRPFAVELYRTLAEGFPIDACVTEGRKAVMAATGLDSPDWGIPVVYTRAPDGRLFAPPDAPPVPAPAQPSSPGGTSVQIGNNNQFNNSPITVDNGASGREQSEDARYNQQLSDTGRILDATRKKRSILQSKKAKMQASVGELIELDETEKEYDDQRRQLLALRKERLSELERRAARPAHQGERQLADDIADLRLSVLEESLDLAQRDVYLLEENRKIQPNDRDRQRVQQQIDAKNAEIAELKRQLEQAR